MLDFFDTIEEKIARLIKNLAALIMLDSMFAGLPLGIYFILQKQKVRIGSLILGISLVLIFSLAFICSHYHKRNIHISEIWFVVSWLVSLFLIYAFFLV